MGKPKARPPSHPAAGKPDAELKKLRETIRREAPFVSLKPFSHNLIGVSLSLIDKNYGRAAANKAVRDFRLEAKGFNQEPEDQEHEAQ